MVSEPSQLVAGDPRSRLSGQANWDGLIPSIVPYLVDEPVNQNAHVTSGHIWAAAQLETAAVLMRHARTILDCQCPNLLQLPGRSSE